MLPKNMFTWASRLGGTDTNIPLLQCHEAAKMSHVRGITDPNDEMCLSMPKGASPTMFTAANEPTPRPHHAHYRVQGGRHFHNTF